MMKEWKEIKEQIDQIDAWDCGAGEVADALQELVEWLDEFMRKYHEAAS